MSNSAEIPAEWAQLARKAAMFEQMQAALRLAAESIGELLDRDEDQESDRRAYDAVCAALEAAEGGYHE